MLKVSSFKKENTVVMFMLFRHLSRASEIYYDYQLLLPMDWLTLIGNRKSNLTMLFSN